jgi:cell division protein FtsB
MKKIILYITNKYLISALFLIVWVLFFDENDYFRTQKSRLNDLATLTKKRAYYVKEIETSQQELSDIQNNDDALEKFARERYLMKKNGEDIFIIENPTP